MIIFNTNNVTVTEKYCPFAGTYYEVFGNGSYYNTTQKPELDEAWLMSELFQYDKMKTESIMADAENDFE